MPVRAATLLLVALSSAPGHAASARSDWVIHEINAYNRPLAAVNHTDLAAKMEKMSASPFAFYRGTNHLFFKDMARLPGSAYMSARTGSTWLGGDTHLGNFGAVRDSDGTLVFGTNDTDEGYLGQYIWDLRRLAASLVLAGRENGVNDADIAPAVGALVDAYVERMAVFKGNDSERDFRLDADHTTGVVRHTLLKAGRSTRTDLLDKYTRLDGGQRVFLHTTELATLAPATRTAVDAGMKGYLASLPADSRHPNTYYAVKDRVQKLGSGTGSLGKLRYWLLLEGPSTRADDDVILEFKQEVRSNVVLAAPGRLPAPAYDSHEGKRVLLTSAAQQTRTEPLLGYTTIQGRPYYGHEKAPEDENLNYKHLDSPDALATAAGYLGQALAVAHARADQDANAAIVSYSIDKQVTRAITSAAGLRTELTAFAFDYADQVALDWQAFVSAYRAGTPLY